MYVLSFTYLTKRSYWGVIDFHSLGFVWEWSGCGGRSEEHLTGLMLSHWPQGSMQVVHLVLVTRTSACAHTKTFTLIHTYAHMHINKVTFSVTLSLTHTHTLNSCLPKHNGPAVLTTQLEESLTLDLWGQLIKTLSSPGCKCPAHE